MCFFYAIAIDCTCLLPLRLLCRNSDVNFHQMTKVALSKQNSTLTFESIRSSVIGDGVSIPGPFGSRALIYADHVASGRSLTFIEEWIRDEVLPFYGNTHTETSWCGLHTTAVREAARAAIRKGVGADDDHVVIFTGAGATAAADKIARILPLGPETTVFIGPYEHHSNDLIWRETEAQIVRIPLSATGGLCFETLEAELAGRAGGGPMFGAFSAASNVTGVLTGISALASLLHRFGALLICDFAAAGPYVRIDMKETAPGMEDRIDVALISAHKFPGGPGASGILVANRSLFDGKKPTASGGGTVSYVTDKSQSYVADSERREEAGTPAIVENIRAGMVFDVKSRVGEEAIVAREKALTDKLDDLLAAIPGVEVLGPKGVPRIGIYSFNIRVDKLQLHHNFVVALLNDLFGIQARGGCSCAGPYGHMLLGIDAEVAAVHEGAVARGLSVFRPGWARLGVSWFFSETVVEDIAAGIEFIARRGLSILPIYTLDPQSGVWRANAEQVLEGKKVPPPCTADFSSIWSHAPAPVQSAPSFEECLAEAHRIADLSEKIVTHEHVQFDAKDEALRWFWLPSEAAAQIVAASQVAKSMKGRE